MLVPNAFISSLSAVGSEVVVRSWRSLPFSSLRVSKS